jgi:hypothetical protein
MTALRNDLLMIEDALRRTSQNLADAINGGERITDDLLFTPSAQEAIRRGLVAKGTVERLRDRCLQIRRIADGPEAAEAWLAEQRAEYERWVKRRKRAQEAHSPQPDNPILEDDE